MYRGSIASNSAESNTPYKAFAKGIRFYVSPYFLQAIVVLTYNILTQYVSKKRISIMYLVIEYLSLSLCTDQFCFIFFARSCGYDCRSSKSSTASSSMVIIGQSKPGLCYDADITDTAQCHELGRGGRHCWVASRGLRRWDGGSEVCWALAIVGEVDLPSFWDIIVSFGIFLLSPA